MFVQWIIAAHVFDTPISHHLRLAQKRNSTLILSATTSCSFGIVEGGCAMSNSIYRYFSHCRTVVDNFTAHEGAFHGPRPHSQASLFSCLAVSAKLYINHCLSPDETPFPGSRIIFGKTSSAIAFRFCFHEPSSWRMSGNFRETFRGQCFSLCGPRFAQLLQNVIPAAWKWIHWSLYDQAHSPKPSAEGLRHQTFELRVLCQGLTFWYRMLNGGKKIILAKLKIS